MTPIDQLQFDTGTAVGLDTHTPKEIRVEMSDTSADARFKQIAGVTLATMKDDQLFPARRQRTGALREDHRRQQQRADRSPKSPTLLEPKSAAASTASTSTATPITSATNRSRRSSSWRASASSTRIGR
jgi:hypothetical protein